MNRFHARVSPVGMAIAATVLLALVLRLCVFIRGHSLTGIVEYDDGPYVASSVLLTHGITPYRDYIFVQPPGITLLLMPVALLARVGLISIAAVMTIGRILTALVSTAGVLVVGLVLRHRGVATVVLGCGLLAVFTGSIEAAHTVLLEPWLGLLCAVGMLLVFDRNQLVGSNKRWLWGGVVFGFAGAVEGWAIVPVAVLAIMLLPDWQRLKRFAGGVAAGFLVPVLPFVLMSPRGFYRGVISAQIGPRAHSLRIPLLYRFKLMAGLHWLRPWSGWDTVLVIALIGGVIVVAAAFTAVVTMRPPPRLDVFVLVVTAGTLLMFLGPSQFLYHFMGYWALWLAMSIALTLTAAADALWGLAPVHRLNLARVLLLAVAVPVLAIFAVLQVDALSHEPPAPVLSARVQRLIPPGSCVLADTSPPLVMASRVVPAHPGCVILLDSTGADLFLSNGLKPYSGAAQVSAVEQMWWRAIRHAQFVLLSHQQGKRIPWTPLLHAYFTHHFRLIFSQRSPKRPGLDTFSYRLYKRTAQPRPVALARTTAYIARPTAGKARATAYIARPAAGEASTPPSAPVLLPAELRLAGLTFLPSVVFVLAAAVLVVCVSWTRRRRRQPGYAPLWALAYVMLLAAAATVRGMVAYGLVGTGKHRG